MACLGEPCPSAWMSNQSAFVQDPVHLRMAARKKKWTHLLPKAGHSRGYLQNLWPFYFTSSSPPPLCAIKETGIQTPIRWSFWDTSLRLLSLPAFRIKSYSLPQRHVSDSLACRAASTASLDLVIISLWHELWCLESSLQIHLHHSWSGWHWASYLTSMPHVKKRDNKSGHSWGCSEDQVNR